MFFIAEMIVTKTQINIKHKHHYHLPGISMVGRTYIEDNPITVYTWDSRLMLFIMTEVTEGSRWLVWGDSRMKFPKENAHIQLKPISIRSISDGRINGRALGRGITVRDPKDETNIELKKLVLAMIEHEQYSNVISTENLNVHNMLDYYQDKYGYERLPLDKVLSLTKRAIAGLPIAYH